MAESDLVRQLTSTSDQKTALQFAFYNALLSILVYMAESDLVRQLTSTSDQKTALQFAFYNAVLSILTAICVLGVYAVYRMLYMFLTPLMWAVLIGTILFPLKRRITSAMNDWLTKLDDDDTPLIIGVLLLPYNALTYWLTKLDDDDTPLIIGVLLLPYNALTCSADLLLYYAFRREGVMVMLVYLILKVLGYGAFMYCIGFLGEAYQWIDSFILFFTKKWMSPIMVLYLATYAGWVYVQDKDKINKMFARVLSLPIWLVVFDSTKGFHSSGKSPSLLTMIPMSPIMVLYLATYAGWVYVQDKDKINKMFARVLSLPIWIFALAFIANFFGPFSVVIFTAMSTALGLIAAGVISAEEPVPSSQVQLETQGSFSDEGVNSYNKANDAKVLKLSVVIFTAMSTALGLIAAGVISAEEPVPNSQVQLETQGEPSAGNGVHANEVSASEHVGRFDKALTGDFYIQAISGLCVLLFAARHDAVVICMILLSIFAILRKIGQALDAQSGISSAMCSLWRRFSAKADRFVHVTVAGPLRKFVKLLFTSDKMMMARLHASLDVLSSVVVMALLAFGLLFTLLFAGFQLHCEALHLAKLGSNVLAAQPDWVGFARNYTEDHLAQHDIDNYVEQAYQKGRTWLADNIRSWVDPKDPERAEILETQVMQLVDNIYKMWEERGSEKTESSTTHAIAKGNWLAQLRGAEFGALKRELTEILQENIETVLNVARSVWSVVLMNISLFSSFFISLAGVVIGFGLDIVNFLIEMIAFLTAVYYLLASSGDEWLPVKWISDALPKSSEGAADANSAFNVKHISTAIEDAISGVFVLSTKMAVFYGLYTYFVHTLFDLNIVFLPSMLAALFAAIPIMAPYVVCAIGIFELYLVRGETAAAILFFILSAAPVTFADAAFYRQLRGSHPYVTGLAIIGGMYWLGLQGAIIGPIILCLLLVLFHVYAKFANA
uniref:Transmembrane protein n=1 Tax=Ascaris lumbricoides TaxID=6252 RepID=A0A9J2PZX0_ASCLU